MTAATIPVGSSFGSKKRYGVRAPAIAVGSVFTIDLNATAPTGIFIHNWIAEGEAAQRRRRAEALAALEAQARLEFPGAAIDFKSKEKVDSESGDLILALSLTIPGVTQKALLAGETTLQDLLIDRFPEVQDSVVVVCKRG